MKKLVQNKTFLLLFFLALYGLSIGVFDNYRELWMSTNHLSTTTISHIISISYIVTVLVLLYFTVKVETDKLKVGILITLIAKMFTSTTLIILNNTNHYFFIKLLMFFDIAFSQTILSSIYPLIMHIEKNDAIYAKKDVVASLFNKIGFLCVSILVGKSLFGKIIDYNTCLLFSVIFTFLAFLTLLCVEIQTKKAEKFDLQKTVAYFKKNKIFISFLIHTVLGSIIWTSILGMPMLTLTMNFQLSSQIASLTILGLGISSNILAMLILKYFRFENDFINLFFKYGARIVLYILILTTQNKFLFLLTIIYMLLTDCTHTFIFTSYFINKIDEEYALLLTILKYSSSLLGNAIGIFFCGLVFSLNIRYLILPAFIFAIIHYLISIKLIKFKKEN